MKSVAVKSKRKGLSDIFKTSWEVFKSGMAGFAGFFSVLIFTKFVASLIGTVDTFYVNFDDVILSSIGFVLIALIKILENFKEE